MPPKTAATPGNIYSSPSAAIAENMSIKGLAAQFQRELRLQ
jgi:hypothetical protein